MKNSILLLIILWTSLNIKAQLQTEWVKSMGDVNTELIYDMALDSQGNMVVLGSIDDYFGGVTCDLDIGPGNTALESSPDGWHNILVAKFDSLGNHIWSFSLWDEALDPQANKLDIDADDNIYITGYLQRQVDIDPGPDTLLLDHNEGGYVTLFAVKYSPDGELIWGDTFEGSSSSVGHQILVEEGNVYLCGEINGIAYTGFNDSTIINNVWSDYNNGFIAKYDTDMNHVWSSPVAAGPGVYNQSTCIAIGQEGQLFAAGKFDGSADFDPSDTEEFLLNSPGPWDDYSADMFIASYDVDGSLINAIQVGSAESFERFSEVFDLKVDQEGNILVTGWYSGLMDFDPGLGINILSGEDDIFLAKYTSDLELIWCFSIAGTYYDIGKEIEIDANNDIYLHGQYYWNGDFDPGPDEFILAGDWQRGFIAKYNENGAFITAADFGAQSSFGYEMHGMEIGENGSLYLAGYYYGEEDFDLDEDEEFILTDQGSGDLYLGKFHYYDPIAPYLESVSPTQIVDDGAVTLHISGYDMEEVVDVRLVAGLDTIHHQSFEADSDFVLDVLFGLEGESSGFYDLHVQLADTLLILTDGIEVLPSLLNLPDGGIEYLSAEQILLNRVEPSIAQVENSGPIDLVAFPVVYRGIYEALHFNNVMPSVDLRQDPSFDALSTQLENLGLDDSLMNEIIVPSTDGELVALVIPQLAAETERTLFLQLQYTDLEPSDFKMIMHANGLLDSEALLPDHVPSPGLCMFEMMTHSLLEATPALETADLESCFEIAMMDLQGYLHSQVLSIGNEETVIPLRGLMMKLGMDVITCSDPSYPIDANVLDSVSVKMIELLGTPIIFGPDFDCTDYVELSELFKQNLLAENEDEQGYFQLLEKGPGPTSQCQAMGITTGYGCTNFDGPCPDPQASMDPNEKYGPHNVEAGTNHLNNGNDLSYSIHFENVDSATVAAKRVLIIDSLDTEVFDLASVNFKYATWGDTIVSINAGANFFDLRPELPNILKITAGIDTMSGVLSCDFETLDTLTMLLTFDIDQGFLPPNVNSPEGMGSIIFDIDLKEDLASGTAFENDALIYFDYNEPISTQAWQNTYDIEPTASHVTENFQVLSDETFLVEWESDDPDDPAYLYAVLVSVNSQDNYELWQDFTSETSGVFEGIIGDTYYFMSAAVDSAMNLEALPSKADAVFFFEADGLTEIHEGGFALFPNPAENLVILRFDDSEVERVELIDVNGRIVYSDVIQRTYEHSIKLDRLPQGIYHVRVSSNQGVMTRRLVVHR